MIELEYIESTGTQYIITPVKLSNNDKYECEFQMKDASQSASLLGIFESPSVSGNTAFYCAGGYFYFYELYLSNNHINVCPTDTNWHSLNVDYEQGKVILDTDSVLFTASTFVNDIECGLFTRYYKGTYSYNLNGRVKYFIVYRNGEKALHLIPCKKTDGTVCMYDKVSDQFFYNQGTGDFIAGPEI